MTPIFPVLSIFALHQGTQLSAKYVQIIDEFAYARDKSLNTTDCNVASYGYLKISGKDQIYSMI